MKKKKNNNYRRQIKCNICLHKFRTQNLDEHMHSRVHHEAIERLASGDQTHMCWACDVSLSGLEQFSKHIETQEHNSKLLSLKQRRESGYAVDYRTDELKGVCAQRRSLLKIQKHKKKHKKWRERKAAKFQDAFHQKSQTNDKHWSTRGQGFGPDRSRAEESNWSAACLLKNENKQGMMNAEPGLESTNNKGAQIVGWNSFCWQASKSTTWSMKEDVDFTSDQLAQSEIFPSWEEYEAQQSQDTSREQDEVMLDRKRSCDAHTSDSPPPVKKQSLKDVPSVKPRFSPSVSIKKIKRERVSQSPSTAAAFRVPGLVQSHMDRLSVMLKDIRKSLQEERAPVASSEDPVTHDGLKRNKPDAETPLSDVPHFSEKCPEESSIKSQKYEEQTCKSERKASPHRQVNSLPASCTEPQEKPEPTQPRHILPSLLSRSVSKTEANKPNLKVARGIRTAHKPSQAAEARVLKPALQKLISSKSSQWRVNWKEIYQEATHRKLQREKGMPRFGIELVTPLPPDPQELEAEELAHFELDEGFQWASVKCDTVTLPCSVNPLSEDACSFPPAEACPTDRQDHGKATETVNHTQKKRDVGEDHSTSGTSGSSEFTPVDSLVCVKTEKLDDDCTEPREEKADHKRIQSPEKDRKKQDFPETHMSSKNPPKCQVNELLAMSLREDELCSSLEDVDSRLLRAQAALQSAFVEVQRLQIIKQQVTAEMSSLRSKRIDILQRIKNSPGSDVETHQ